MSDGFGLKVSGFSVFVSGFTGFVSMFVFVGFLDLVLSLSLILLKRKKNIAFKYKKARCEVVRGFSVLGTTNVSGF